MLSSKPPALETPSFRTAGKRGGVTKTVRAMEKFAVLGVGPISTADRK
jgi:hypothetical protein